MSLVPSRLIRLCLTTVKRLLVRIGSVTLNDEGPLVTHGLRSRVHSLVPPHPVNDSRSTSTSFRTSFVGVGVSVDRIEAKMDLVNKIVFNLSSTQKWNLKDTYPLWALEQRTDESCKGRDKTRETVITQVRGVIHEKVWELFILFTLMKETPGSVYTYVKYLGFHYIYTGLAKRVDVHIKFRYKDDSLVH